MGKWYTALDRSGVQELLQSEEAMEVCMEKATAAQEKLGEGYEVTSRVGKTRASAKVAAVTPAARRDNLKNNSILKALS